MSQKFGLRFFGSAQTVTGSKMMLTYNNKHYLFDCGLFQGPKSLREKNWTQYPELQKCEAVILSHAHIDHSGYLPKLVKDGFHGKIYSTQATSDLCQLLLMDAAYLQEEDAKFANKTGYSHHNPAIPLFDEIDAKKTLELFEPQAFATWIPLTDGLSFRFLRAGHILGSAITQFSYLSEAKMKIVTFTGDLGNGRSWILEDPDQILETDYLICESTYGDRRQSRENVLDTLATIINRVLDRGGTLIIPAFAIGRTQEILYLVNTLETQGKIKKYPVYLDSPMATSATEIYLKHQDELKKEIIQGSLESNLSCAHFKRVKSSDDSMLLCMSTEPKIVISAAGMLSGGRVLHHLKSKLPDPKSGVLFVGYQATGTKGLLLKNGLRDIRIHHQKVTVEAEIMSIDSLSAHADCDDLKTYIGNIQRKPEQVILNHGEINALESLKYILTQDFGLKVTIAEENKDYIF